jgi:hypothetical protein
MDDVYDFDDLINDDMDFEGSLPPDYDDEMEEMMEEAEVGQRKNSEDQPAETNVEPDDNMSLAPTESESVREEFERARDTDRPDPFLFER